MFSYMPYIADIGVTYGGVGVKMGGLGTIGMSIKALNIGTIAITTVDQPDGTGETFSPTFFVLGFTYSRTLTDRVSVGANFNLVSERFPRASLNAFAVDVGIQYRDVGGVGGLSAGVVVKNLGPSVKYDGPGLYRVANDTDTRKEISYLKINAAEYELPSIIEIAVSYSYDIGEYGKATASYLFANNNFADDESKIGAEFAYKDLAFVRAGYTMTPDKPEDYEYIWGPTFGGGVHLKTGGVNIWIDYAYRSVDFFDSSNVFSLKFGF